MKKISDKKRNYGKFICIAIITLVLSACKKTSQAEPREWTITQYGDGSSVMMFYTITDQAGNLVIVDGGYDTNTEVVRAVIEAHNNHVAAWIITHAHPDHVMAFNEIMKNPGEIVVDKIYTVEINYERYKETAQWYDKIEVYEKFVAVTQGMENIIYLKENDELDLLGLHMKVLHVWDEHTEGLTEHAINNGSLVFTLQGEQEKMLFCADIDVKTEKEILDRHLKELEDVDYIQLGHHGNWGLSTSFYGYMNPVAVFFDAPEWLVNDTQSAYDAWLLKDYFVERDVHIYICSPDENAIILR